MSGKIASVLFPLPLPEAFDYSVPDGVSLAVGDHVTAPLGPRTIRGVVSGLRDSTGGNRPLKPLVARLDDTPLPVQSLEFISWAARYSVDTPGSPLAMTLRGLRAPLARPTQVLAASGRLPPRLTPARQKVLDVLQAESLPQADLIEQSGASAAVIKGLIDAGAVIRQTLPVPLWPAPDLATGTASALSPAQQSAAEALASRVRKNEFGVTLLDGITGSGKTEVYLEAVAAALESRATSQILILLPEIALTQAVLARVERRFGAPPAQWHSGLGLPLRRRVWEGVASGEIRIVIGARSALFLPFRDLSLVIVDEEHDGSYKQEDGFIYHGRDLAVVRARQVGCLAVLASATPSMESMQNAISGRYAWLRLTARHGTAVLPDIQLLDLKACPPEKDRWLSPALVLAIGETLLRGEQTLLFLNRRGYAPLVLCKACGERMTAPDTDSWLVEHRYTNRLVCHLTGFSMLKPERCPHCDAADSLVAIGPGVERIDEEVRERFPQARVAVFSSDRIHSSEDARELVAAMEAGEIDILVATQAAAKGHNFPNLTLVGVVDADLGLRGGDLRAGERTFQLLAQATGRAGRHERPGRAILQTWQPDHPVMLALAAQDREAFMAAELEMRQLGGLPPFGRLAAMIVSGPDFEALENFCSNMMTVMPDAPGVDAFGPADAPLAMVRGRRRKRVLVRCDRGFDLSGYMAAWRARLKVPGSIRLTIDIDPYSFL